jgi:hypothetical protein
MGRIDDPLAVHTTDPHRTNRPAERNVGHAQRRGCAVDAQNVRIVFLVGA